MTFTATQAEIDRLNAEIERLKAERDERTRVARWLFANLDHAAEHDIEGAALKESPWLEEMEDDDL